jgi:hypothetical protein
LKTTQKLVFFQLSVLEKLLAFKKSS